MRAKCGGMYNMDLINKQVEHKVFGKGTVVKYDDLYVVINFSSESSGNKKFVFPDAFGTYLTLTDQKAAGLVKKMVQEKKEEYKIEKLKLKKLEALQKERLQYFLKRDAQKRKPGTRKVNPRSQSVFWCKGEEQESIFADWNVFTGIIKSGQRKGQPKRLAQINQNSTCLLTAREPGEPEKDRRILGAFMVSENFSPKLCKDGYIPAHSEYRFRLSERESKKMLFWNYYVNKRFPHKITWNTGRHRYFDNTWMAKILRDVISIKKKPREREIIQYFFEHFCLMNRVNVEELPKPSGTLTRI